MTNTLSYRINYFYESGEGSEAESFTNEAEALTAFKEMVEELKEEWETEPTVVDYAMLYSCVFDEEEEENDIKHILFWTFDWGFTENDPPVGSPEENS